MFGGKKKLFRKKVKNLSKSPHFTVYIFHLILVGILSILILSIKNRQEGEGEGEGEGGRGGGWRAEICLLNKIH